MIMMMDEFEDSFSLRSGEDHLLGEIRKRKRKNN